MHHLYSALCVGDIYIAKSGKGNGTRSYGEIYPELSVRQFIDWVCVSVSHNTWCLLHQMNLSSQIVSLGFPYLHFLRSSGSQQRKNCHALKYIWFILTPMVLALSSKKIMAVRKYIYSISPSLYLVVSTVCSYSIKAPVEELKEKGDMPWILLMIWLYLTGLNVSRCHTHSKVLWATPRVCSSKCLPPNMLESYWMWQVLDKYVKLAECQSCRSWLWFALRDGCLRPSSAICSIGL